MKNKNEDGITLITLVITIIIILIITSISLSTGKEAVFSTQFTIIQSELAMVQSKVNEISDKYQDSQIGQTLTTENQAVLNTTEVTNELTKKANNSTTSLEDIKDGFRLFTNTSLSQLLSLDGLSNDFLINIKECIVILADVFEYEGVNYYMQEQMSIGLYNVTFNNQISSTGNFSATSSRIADANTDTIKYQIELSIIHNKYVSKWQVQYRLQNDTYWKTANNTTFTVDTPGTYEIKVTHSNQINLGTQTIVIEP